VKLLFKTKR